MRHQFRAGVVHGLDRRAGELELAARLERDRAAAGHVEHADDIAVLDNRLPAEQVLHAFEQRTDAAPALIRDRPMALDSEWKFLVLGADAEFRLRRHAAGEPRDQGVARFDRRHVDLITSHDRSRLRLPRVDKGPRPYTGAIRQGNRSHGNMGRGAAPSEVNPGGHNLRLRALLKTIAYDPTT
jgi:hypothetical protein